MANTGKGSLDPLNKVAIGLGAFILLFAVCSDDPENDAWDGDESATADDGGTAVDPDDPWSAGAPTGDGDDGESATPVDDPWTRGGPADEGDDGGSATPVDDPWTRGGPTDDGDDDEEPQLPADDPWTRGAPAGAGDDDDDDGPDELPADDPWTRGAEPTGGGGGPSPCMGAMEFVTSDGKVQLPTDRPEDAFASADCAIPAGGTGDPVWLVQVALNDCNGQSVPVTGTYDGATRLAVAAVQSHNGLTADGIYGPDTREVMAWPTDPGSGRLRCRAHPGIG